MYASLTNVQVPCNLPNPGPSLGSCYSFRIEYLITELDKRELSCVPFTVNDRYYIRFACQIYNEELDYEILASIVLDLISNVPPEEQEKQKEAVQPKK